MRYRLMASYLGASYQAAVGPTDRDVTLFAAPPPPEEHGFSPVPGGLWRKYVRVDELDALWESRPIGSYHGEPCLVLDDLGDRLHIVYLGMDERRAGQLGYWQVDRGVFEVVVARHEVTDLAEERHEFPIALLLSALPRALSAGGTSGPGAGSGTGAGLGSPGTGLGSPGNGGLGNGGPAMSGPRSGGQVAAWNGQPASGPYQLPAPPQSPSGRPQLAAAGPPPPGAGSGQQLATGSFRGPSGAHQVLPQLPGGRASLPSAVPGSPGRPALGGAQLPAGSQFPAGPPTGQTFPAPPPVPAPMPALPGSVHLPMPPAPPPAPLPGRRPAGPSQAFTPPPGPAPQGQPGPAQPGPAAHYQDYQPGPLPLTGQPQQAVAPWQLPNAPPSVAVAAGPGSPPADGNGLRYYQPADLSPQHGGPGQNGTGQNGTGQNWPGQNGTGQNGTGQNWPGQNWPGQNGTGQNGTGQNGLTGYAQPGPGLGGYQQAPPAQQAPAQLQAAAPPQQAPAPPRIAPAQPELTQPAPRPLFPPFAQQAAAPVAAEQQQIAVPAAPSAAQPQFRPGGAANVAGPAPAQAALPPAAPAQAMPAMTASPLSAPLMGAAAPSADYPATGPLPPAYPADQAPPAPPEPASAGSPPAGGTLSKLTGAVRGRRAARKPRLAMSAIFADLVDLAHIPRSAYAVDDEVTGAMCLFKTDGGYEVFSCAEDARHEVRFFEDEEAAYFYLFGVLAAEALRNGRLSPR